MTPTESKSPGAAFRLWSPRIEQALAQINLPDYTTFTVLSILTGVAAGLASVVFHQTIDLFSDLFSTHVARRG